MRRTPYESCPLCGCTDSIPGPAVNCTQHPCYQPSLPPVMQWLDCPECGHQYTDGYFEGEALELVLQGAPEDQDVPGTREQIDWQRARSSELIEKVGSPKGTRYWLDVGFGSGSLVATAAEFGFEAIGIDIRERNVSALLELGYQARCCTINELAGHGIFSVISMCDVLEHDPFPRKALQSASELIDSWGYLIVSCPNRDSLPWRQMSSASNNPYLYELEHFHNFTRKTLYNLLSQTGFEPVSYGISRRYTSGMEVIAKLK